MLADMKTTNSIQEVLVMKVLNYGSLNVDYVYSVDHIIVGGETQQSLKMETFSGGKGLNQSIALAKASSIAVSRPGAAPSIPSMEEIKYGLEE